MQNAFNIELSGSFLESSEYTSQFFTSTFQGLKKKLFRAGEVSWNTGTSINISSTIDERKALYGKNSIKAAF